LINPPNQNIKNSVKDLLYGCWCQGKRIGGGEFPPLNLISIATLLEKDNNVKVINYKALKLIYQDLIKYLANFEIVIFPTTSFCYLEDINFLKNLKALNPEIKSIIFGQYSTFYPNQCIGSEYIDFGIIGEPEFTIRNLINNLFNGNNKEELKNLRGLCFKDEHKIINTGKAPYIKNLDSLPIPNRDFIKDVYFFNPLVKNKEWTTALTSRGCPASCNFCLSPEFYGYKYRYQSPERMIQEIEYITEIGYNEIFYRDETFTGNKKRVEKFCFLIKKKKIDFDWICNIRVGTVNKNLLGLMKLSGCHLLKIGVEAGSQKILNNLKKEISLGSIIKTFKWAHELRINTHAHLILGAPGETIYTLRKTIDFVKKLKPTTVTFNLFTPFPGTKIYKELEKKCKEKLDITSLKFQTCLTTPYLSNYYTNLDYSFLRRLIPWAYRKFYLRIKYFFSQLKELNSFYSLKRIIKSSLNVISFILKKDDSEAQDKGKILDNL